MAVVVAVVVVVVVTAQRAVSMKQDQAAWAGERGLSLLPSVASLTRRSVALLHAGNERTLPCRR